MDPSAEGVGDANHPGRRLCAAGPGAADRLCRGHFFDAAATADSTYFNAIKTKNTVLTDVTDAMLVDPYKFSGALQTPAGMPNYLLQAGSPAASGADFNGFSGFQSVAYRGAFNTSDNWLSGWTTFSAETNNY